MESQLDDDEGKLANLAEVDRWNQAATNSLLHPVKRQEGRDQSTRDDEERQHRRGAHLGRQRPDGMTEFTVTDKRALRQEILQVRQQGYAMTAQELRRGFHAVAVPLRRYDGGTIGAMCVAAWLEDSVAGAMPDKYLAVLQDETRALQPQLL